MLNLPLDHALQLSFVWLGMCTVAYYLLPRCGADVWRASDSQWLWVMIGVAALALFVRLIPAILLPRGAQYDIESFRRVAETFLKGDAVYSSPTVADRHPYLPFQVYLIGAAGKLAEGTGVPFVLAIKLVPILADAALAVLILQASRRLGRSLSESLVWSLLYALSPVSILVSAYHGQFDGETVLLVALSWYLWRFGASPAKQLYLSSVVLGLAVANKTWPLLFLPVVVMRLTSLSKRVIFALITLAVPIVFTAFYIVAFQQDPYPLLHRALTHSGVPGWWGGGAILNLVRQITGSGGASLAWLADNGRWLVFVGAAFVYWKTRREDALDAFTTLLVVLYLLTSGFGLQWTVWVVPFAVLVGDLTALNWYTLGALLYMLPAYYGYHFDPVLLRWFSPEHMNTILIASAVPVWVLVARWAWRRLTAVRRAV